MKVSAHLSWSELACKDGTPYPTKWVHRAKILAEEFERIRAACGNKPIVVGSAYRTEAHNRRVGGARNSQHVEGRALDLYPPKGMSVERFFSIVREIALTNTSQIYGLGRYPTFVHIDIRPEPSHGRLVAWSGGRAWAEEKR